MWWKLSMFDVATLWNSPSSSSCPAQPRMPVLLTVSSLSENDNSTWCYQQTVTHDASFQRKSRASESLTLLRAASVRRNPARTVGSDNTNSTWWNNIAITSTTLTTGQTNIAKHHKTSSALFTMFWQIKYFISIFLPIKKSNFAIQRWLIQKLKTTVTSRHGRQGSCMFEFSQFSKLFFLKTTKDSDTDTDIEPFSKHYLPILLT